MKKILERHNQTVLVAEGVPYSLVREIEPKTNDVCSICDLNELCHCVAGKLGFLGLCQFDDDDQSWFFVQDWDILDKPLVCYATGDHSIAENTSEQEKRDV